MKPKKENIEVKSNNDANDYLAENRIRKKPNETKEEDSEQELNSEKKREASKPLYLKRYE